MVQVIPKKEAKQQSAIKKILPWLSFLLVLIIIALYFILFYQVDRTRIALERAEKDLAQSQTERDIDLNKEIIAFRTKSDDVVRLIKERKEISDFFESLEASTHPALYFTSLSLMMEKGEAVLGGTANDFTAIGEQILIFNNEAFVKKAKLLNVSFTEEGNIEFSIKILLFLREKEDI